MWNVGNVSCSLHEITFFQAKQTAKINGCMCEIIINIDIINESIKENKQYKALAVMF